MTEVISSLQNARVKSAVKLRRRRHREQQGCTIIDGTREISRAMDAHVPLVEVFVCEQNAPSPQRDELIARLRATGVTLTHVTERVFTKLAFGDRAEGLVAIAKPPVRDLVQLPLSDDSLIAVLDGVEKPGNLGAIVRSANGAGVSALVVTNRKTDIYNPNAIRASLGTIFCSPVCDASVEQTIHMFRRHHVRMIAADVQGASPYDQIDMTGAVAIVLGSEATGLSDQWKEGVSLRARIPMCGVADSLNVSAAAAVLFYEALRQRRPGSLGASSAT